MPIMWKGKFPMTAIYDRALLVRMLGSPELCSKNERNWYNCWDRCVALHYMIGWEMSAFQEVVGRTVWDGLMMFKL